jgi:serine/threonine protein kinase
VIIHHEHHDFHNPVFENAFAIKQLHTADQADFQREVDILKKFSDNRHPHLISLLATFEQFGRFYLIFHWAKCDLLRYWKDENPNPEFNIDTVRWFAEQCEGIADGLLQIHKYRTRSLEKHDKGKNLLSPASAMHPTTLNHSELYGRHGDIKPENILLFNDAKESRGILKISDFGLAELNTRQSRSVKPRSQVGNSPTYRPPECDMPGKVIRRSYDIWTLGCLYLEFVTWLLGGRDLFEEFGAKRLTPDPWIFELKEDMFFEIVKCEDADGTVGAMVKPAVTMVSSRRPICRIFFFSRVI